MRRFSIIMPSWDDLKYLKLALSSLKVNSTCSHEVLVHLNTYTDESESFVQEYDPGYTKSEENKGISYATNKCAERATTEWFFFPNSDMVFLPGWDVELDKAIDKYGDRVVYSSTLIEPSGANPNFIIRNYGREPEDLKLDTLKNDIQSMRTGKYNVKHTVPFLIPNDLFSPYDERMFPGWVTDDDIMMSVYTNDSDVKFIQVADSLIYHFMCKCTHKIGTESERAMLGMNAQRIFNTKWSQLYPGITSENYRTYIYSE